MKHVPQRSCIVCREQKDKSALIRIVRAPDGVFSLDATGKLPGRGAYVCAEGDCMSVAIKKKVLNRVYKAQLPQELYDSLDAQYKRFCDERG